MRLLCELKQFWLVLSVHCTAESSLALVSPVGEKLHLRGSGNLLRRERSLGSKGHEVCNLEVICLPLSSLGPLQCNTVFGG